MVIIIVMIHFILILYSIIMLYFFLQTFNAALEEKHRKPKFLHDVLLVLHKVFQFSSEELLEVCMCTSAYTNV